MSVETASPGSLPLGHVAVHRIGLGRLTTTCEAAFWLLPLGAFFLLPDYLALGNQILIACLFALSLDLILGYAGIISLGHAAFFGLGAYTAGLLAAHHWGEPISGLICAGLVAGLLGYLTSFLIVRGNDLTRILITLAIGYLLLEAANKATSLTGGADGLSGIEMWKLLGQFRFDLAGRAAYLYSLVVLVLAFLLVRTVVRSPFGLSLRGIKDCAKRMPALGTDVSRQLKIAYTLGAILAGIAGGLLAQTTQFVGLDVLSFQRSAEVLIMVILGGVGRLYGGIIGAALFIIAHDILSTADAVYWQFWLGIMLMAAVFVVRGGLMAGVASLSRIVEGRARR
jgi:branched-chain amino acid transport system permease protein